MTQTDWICLGILYSLTLYIHNGEGKQDHQMTDTILKIHAFLCLHAEDVS